MNIKFLIITLFFLNSCGFTPIYYNFDSDSKDYNYHEKLTLVKIKKYRSDIDYKLHDHLTKILNPYNNIEDKKYILDIKLTDQISSTFTTSTGSSGRNKITLNANYQLIDIKSGDILGSGRASESGDFDVGNKRFANYTTQEETKLYLTKLIATDIRNMIINDLYQ
ncbi:hypothetical protein N8772_01270 [Rickettsiales bacterium]|nr:hypothetical protein [Rickettsiales bacterium]MDB2550309.1 hypothetical protein [Rickettsiales bacterium]